MPKYRVLKELAYIQEGKAIHLRKIGKIVELEEHIGNEFAHALERLGESQPQDPDQLPPVQPAYLSDQEPLDSVVDEDVD